MNKNIKSLEKEREVMLVDIKEIKKIETVDQLENLYSEFLLNFSCRPDRDNFPYPKQGTIFDENKSVKWNRDQVIKLRDAHDTECIRLQKLKNSISKAYEDTLICLLVKEYKLSTPKAELIFSYAYSESHSEGLYAVIGTFRDVAELVNDIEKLSK